MLPLDVSVTSVLQFSEGRNPLSLDFLKHLYFIIYKQLFVRKNLFLIKIKLLSIFSLQN